MRIADADCGSLRLAIAIRIPSPQSDQSAIRNPRSAMRARSAPERRPRLLHRRRDREGAGLRALRADRFTTGSGTRARSRRRAPSPRALGVERHLELEVDLRPIGGSSLTSDAPVPHDRDLDADRHSVDLRARRATRSSCRSRSAGPRSSARTTSSSASTRSTIRAIPTAGRSSSPRSSAWRSLATRAGVEGGGRFRVHTPLIALSKAEIIRRGLELGLDYGLTHSCYDPAPDGRPCGTCDSCVLRAQGFARSRRPRPAAPGLESRETACASSEASPSGARSLALPARCSCRLRSPLPGPPTAPARARRRAPRAGGRAGGDRRRVSRPVPDRPRLDGVRAGAPSGRDRARSRRVGSRFRGGAARSAAARQHRPHRHRRHHQGQRPPVRAASARSSALAEVQAGRQLGQARRQRADDRRGVGQADGRARLSGARPRWRDRSACWLSRLNLERLETLFRGIPLPEDPSSR